MGCQGDRSSDSMTGADRILTHLSKLAMNCKSLTHFVILLALFLPAADALAQKLEADIAYGENGHKRQVLDIYTPEKPDANPRPVMFWIHGGGWQVGDKSDVALKPKVLVERGFVFVSTNYRLLPDVDMETLTGDVAKALGWVHQEHR